jgi:hypothetical protein
MRMHQNRLRQPGSWLEEEVADCKDAFRQTGPDKGMEV